MEIRLKKFVASILLFATLFTQGQPGYCDDRGESLYRQQVSLEQQKVYDKKIEDATGKLTISLSPLYKSRTHILQKLRGNKKLGYDQWLFLTTQLKFIDEAILEAQTINAEIAPFIQSLYQHIALCYVWGNIPFPPIEPYPYSIAEQGIAPPGQVGMDKISDLSKTAAAKDELGRIAVPQVVNFKTLASLGFLEREGTFLKDKSNVLSFLKPQEKLSSPFLDSAPKGSIRIRIEVIVTPGDSNKDPTVESVTILNAPTEVLQDQFKREKESSIPVKWFKSFWKFLN